MLSGSVYDFTLGLGNCASSLVISGLVFGGTRSSLEECGAQGAA